MISDTEMLSLLALALIGIMYVSKSSPAAVNTGNMAEMFQKHKVVIGIMGVVILVYFMHQWGMFKSSTPCRKTEGFAEESFVIKAPPPQPASAGIPDFVTLPPKSRAMMENFQDAPTVEGNFLNAPSHTKMFDQIITDPTHAYAMGVAQNDPTRDINLCPTTRKFLTQDLRHQIAVPVQEENIPFGMSSQISKNMPPTCINRGIDAHCHTRM